MAAANANRATETQVAPTTHLRPWRTDDLEHRRLHDLQVLAFTRNILPHAD